MAAAAENSLLFQELRAEGKRIVQDPPKLDLESYISNYDGITRLLRLHTIATSCPFLSAEAFRMAITEAKQGMDVNLYLKLVEDFQKLLPEDPLAQIDTTWAENTTKRVKAETDRLEHELRTYKNNLIKESIRMGQEDLGTHYFGIGDLPTSFKSFSKMREYCTTSKQIAQMTFKLLYVSIFQRNWVIAQSYQLKMQALQISDDDKKKYDPILAACVGLAQLQQGSYKEAAVAFLSVDQIYTSPEPQAGITFQKMVITPNDVAVYGGLCALATMDRAELQRRVLENSSFRPLLELEPHIRRAISMFCASKYTGCLGILESYMEDYLLDMYLQDHFLNLYRQVRSKCIVQWFSAFSVVTWEEIEKAFPQKLLGGSIEQELEAMIKSGELDARIDLVDKLLISPNPDPRISVIQDTLAMAKNTERSLRLRLHRINMQAAGLVVKSPNQSQVGNLVSAYDDGGDKSGGFTHGSMGLRGLGKLKRGGSGLGGGFSSMV